MLTVTIPIRTRTTTPPSDDDGFATPAGAFTPASTSPARPLAFRLPSTDPTNTRALGSAPPHAEPPQTSAIFAEASIQPQPLEQQPQQDQDPLKLPQESHPSVQYDENPSAEMEKAVEMASAGVRDTSSSSQSESHKQDQHSLENVEESFSSHGGYEPLNEPAAPFASWPGPSAEAETITSPRYSQSLVRSLISDCMTDHSAH